MRSASAYALHTGDVAHPDLEVSVPGSYTRLKMCIQHIFYTARALSGSSPNGDTTKKPCTNVQDFFWQGRQDLRSASAYASHTGDVAHPDLTVSVPGSYTRLKMCIQHIFYTARALSGSSPNGDTTKKPCTNVQDFFWQGRQDLRSASAYALHTGDVAHPDLEVSVPGSYTRLKMCIQHIFYTARALSGSSPNGDTTKKPCTNVQDFFGRGDRTCGLLRRTPCIPVTSPTQT